MSKLTVFVLIMTIFFSLRSVAQNQAPQVTNLHFSQRTDGTFKVDIFYDVNDPDDNTMTVSMKASDDNGSTWTYDCPSISGNTGPNQTSNLNKHIIWDFAIDHPNTFGTNYKIKIIADDGATPMGQPCPGFASITYGGQVYNTVQIDTQCWIKENLNIGTMINGSSTQTNNGTIEKYCYNNDPANCLIYGGLYQWYEMMQYNIVEGLQGICPTGWHVPAIAEWNSLVSFLGGTSIAGSKLMETGLTHWFSPNIATNESGFTALGAGLRGTYGSFGGLQGGAYFWSSSSGGANGPWSRSLLYGSAGIGLSNYNEAGGFSVRCVKNQ